MNIIVKPLISEKMTRLTEAAAEPKLTRIQRNKGIQLKPANNRYGFIVRPEANKLQIKEEVERLYNVTVVDVNTMLFAGKRSQRYTKAGMIKGQKSSFKKAIVTLKEGETIDFYSNI